MGTAINPIKKVFNQMTALDLSEGSGARELLGKMYEHMDENQGFLGFGRISSDDVIKQRI